MAGGSVTQVKVTGRGGVPADASSVAVNVTAINPTLAGFLTVFPCGEQIPVASTLNFTPGAIVPNSAVVKVGADGAICIYSNTETDIVVDVNGYDAAQAVVRLFEPTRVLETRAGLVTADGLDEFNGPRPSDSVLELPIGGRVGVPNAIRAAVLNITVTEATGSRLRHGVPVRWNTTGCFDAELRTGQHRRQPRSRHDVEGRQGVHLHPDRDPPGRRPQRLPHLSRPVADAPTRIRRHRVSDDTNAERSACASAS